MVDPKAVAERVDNLNRLQATLTEKILPAYLDNQQADPELLLEALKELRAEIEVLMRLASERQAHKSYLLTCPENATLERTFYEQVHGLNQTVQQWRAGEKQLTYVHYAASRINFSLGLFLGNLKGADTD